MTSYMEVPCPVFQEPFLEAVDPVVVFGGEDEDNSLEAFVVREGELVPVPHFEEVRFGRTFSHG